MGGADDKAVVLNVDRGDADDFNGLLGSRIRLRRTLLVCLRRVLLLMLGMGMLVTRLLLLLLGVMAIGQCVGAIGDDAGVIVIMALLDMS